MSTSKSNSNGHRRSPETGPSSSNSSSPPQDDLYTTLDLAPNATQSQIKSAYRKLALKYHPDKQSSDEDKKRCSEIFTRIGNAYEVLADPQRRKMYDQYGTTDPINDTQQNDHRQRRETQRNDPFSDPFFSDPFFRHGRSGGFMDPFDLFRQFFGDDVSHQFHNNEYGRSTRGRDDGHDRTTDPRDNLHRRMQEETGFGSFGGFGGGMMNGMGMGMGMGFGDMGFGGFGGMGMGMGIPQHMQSMNSMMNLQSSFPSMMQSGNRSGATYHSSTTSSSSTGGRGVSESVSTSTRIINGKRQTVTERVKVHPDGRVERTTETSGDDDFPADAAMLGYETRNGRHEQLMPSEEQNEQTNSSNGRSKKRRLFGSRRDDGNGHSGNI